MFCRQCRIRMSIVGRPVATSINGKWSVEFSSASCKILPAHINAATAGNFSPSQRIDRVGGGAVNMERGGF